MIEFVHWMHKIIYLHTDIHAFTYRVIYSVCYVQ